MSIIVSDYLEVASGESYSDVQVMNGAYVMVNEGGSIDGMTIEQGGWVSVDSGGTATAVRENGGYLDDWYGAVITITANTIDSLTLDHGEYATVHAGTTINSTTLTGSDAGGYLEGGWLDIREGAVLSNMTVTSGAMASVMGAVTSASVSSEAYIDVYESGLLNSAFFNEKGKGNVNSGGFASNTVVNSGGSFAVYGGSADAILVNDGGYVVVQEVYNSDTDLTSSGFATNIDVMEGGRVRVVSNGVAQGVNVSGGILNVLSGSAEKVVMSGGSVVATGTSEGVGVISGLTMNAGIAEIESGASVDGAVLAGGETNIRSASLLSGAVVGEGATVNIYGSGSELELNGGVVTLTPVTVTVDDVQTVVGGTVNTAVLNGGSFILESGALVEGATVNSGFIWDAPSDTLIYDTVVQGGTVNVAGVANNTQMTAGAFSVVSGGSANNIAAKQGAVKIDGCQVHTVILGEDPDPDLGLIPATPEPIVATLDLVNDGSIENLTVSHQGTANLYDGTVTGATMTDYDAFINVYEDAELSGVTVDGGTVNVSGGFVTGLAMTGSVMHLVGGYYPKAIPNGAALNIFEDGVVEDVELNSAFAKVGSDGILFDVSVNSASQIQIASGGILSGDVTIMDDRNTWIDVEAGGVINFDLTPTAPGAAAKITNLIRVFGTPTYSMTVNANQTAGVYCLTDKAGAFASSITITDTELTVLGTISLTQSIQVGGNYYSLHMNHGALNLSISAAAPEAPEAAVYVNTAWKDLADGTVVDIDGGTAVIGVTGFADGDDAMSNVTPDGVLTVLGGTVSFAYGIYRNTVAADGVVIADTDVLHGGSLVLQSGATGINLNIDEEASLTVNAGSELTGECFWEASSYIALNGNVDFDVSGLTPESGIILYNYLSSYDAGNPTYSLTIGENQTNGTYTLAVSPMSSSTPVTLRLTDGTELGDLAADTPFVYNEQTYTLEYRHVASFDTLSLVVDEFIPTSEVIYVNSEWTGLPRKTVVDVDGTTATIGETAFATPDAGLIYLVEGGTFYIAGGTAEFSDPIVRNVLVQSGAELTNPVLTSGISLTVDAGATLTLNNGSTAVFADGMNVTVNGTLFFDLTAYSTETAFLTGYSFIQGTTTFATTVGSDLTRGTYTLFTDGAGFTGSLLLKNQLGEDVGTLAVDDTIRYDNVLYTLNNGTDGSLTLTVKSPPPVNCDIDGNYISEVMFVWKENNQIVYWMNGQPECESALSSHPADWNIFGSYDMDSDGKADAVMIGNGIGKTAAMEDIEGVYVGYYPGGNDLPDGSTWVKLGFMENPDHYEWENAVGNLTGNGNSLVWFAKEQGILGVWLDGTDEWQLVTNAFSGEHWTLAGCGDFDGDGVDSILMCHNGYQYYFANLDGTFDQLSIENSIWDSCEVRAIGDFSGDGIDDIVLYAENTGSIYLLNNGNPDDYTPLAQLDAATWDFLGCGDYNGDHIDDLLVRQYSDSSAIGYFSGTDKTPFYEIGCGVDNNWSVVA